MWLCLKNQLKYFQECSLVLQLQYLCFNKYFCWRTTCNNHNSLLTTVCLWILSKLAVLSPSYIMLKIMKGRSGQAMQVSGFMNYEDHQFWHCMNNEHEPSCVFKLKGSLLSSKKDFLYDYCCFKVVETWLLQPGLSVSTLSLHIEDTDHVYSRNVPSADLIYIIQNGFWNTKLTWNGSAQW